VGDRVRSVRGLSQAPHEEARSSDGRSAGSPEHRWLRDERREGQGSAASRHQRLSALHFQQRDPVMGPVPLLVWSMLALPAEAFAVESETCLLLLTEEFAERLEAAHVAVSLLVT